MKDIKKETAPAATETASNISTDISIYETAATVNAPPNWWSDSDAELRAVRVLHGLKGADMANTVRELYPRHNRQLLSHCEHGAETGVMLRPDALSHLKARFCPDFVGRPVSLPAKRKTPWRSRTKQIHCRLTDEKFEALQRKLRQDGLTAQAFIEEKVDIYLNAQEKMED